MSEADVGQLAESSGERERYVARLREALSAARAFRWHREGLDARAEHKKDREALRRLERAVDSLREHLYACNEFQAEQKRRLTERAESAEAEVDRLRRDRDEWATKYGETRSALIDDPEEAKADE